MAGAGAKIFVDKKLAQRKVLVFAKTYSPESQAVQKLLDEYNMKHPTVEIINIEARQDCNQIENYFQILCLTDRREVPQLFLDGKHIGGEKEITRMHDSGELRKLLTAAGAL